MAKKKSKSNIGLIMSVVLIALSVLTICTLFMPIFKTVVESLLGDTSSTIKGADALTALFNGEMSVDFSEGANSLIALKTSEDAAFVTTVFLWGYMLTLAVSVATLVFAVLSILGLRFKLVNTILGAALVILAIVTFIFAIIVAGKFGSVDLGSLVSGKTHIGFAIYCLIGTLVAGCAQVYNARN